MKRKSERRVLSLGGSIALGISCVSSSCLECISSQWHSLPPSSSLYFSCCRGDCPQAIKVTISTPPPTPPLHAEIRLGLIFHQQSMKSSENATQQALLWGDTLPVQPPTQVYIHTHTGTHPQLTGTEIHSDFWINYEIKWMLNQSDNQRLVDERINVTLGGVFFFFNTF